WQDLMYEAMDVVGVDQEPIRDNAKWACVYFFVSILFGFLLWANLFVSALIDNFNRIAHDENDGKLLVTDEQRVWQQAMLLATVHADNSWRRSSPETPWKAVVHGVVSKYTFDAFSVFMIVLNMVTMMAIRANPSKSEDDYQVWMGNTLAIWYMLEAYLLIVAMKWKNYWQSGWNKIDFIVAVSGVVGLLIPDVYESGVGGAFRMLRFLRLFKIVQVSKGLRTLFATFLSAIPGVVNVALLSLLFMYIYACLGVALF
ncbi:VIC family transporter: sodium ion channel, partial [Ostreococcus lucimarinus CCE9901]